MSYNGYNYSHYFDPTTQRNGRIESNPNQPLNSAIPTLSAPSYGQQQTRAPSYPANQPPPPHDQQQRSAQATASQWYMDGSGTSVGGYQPSMTATSVSGPQTHYIGGTGRNGNSHLDTSALGSLAYASGLESSGADSQLLQRNSRSTSDYGSTPSRIQTPSARLVSSTHGGSTALANGNNHVRSDSVSSAQSQSLSRAQYAQHPPRSHDNSQTVNPTLAYYRPYSAGPASDPSRPQYGRYSNNVTPNAGANHPRYEAHSTEITSQRMHPSVPQHRTGSPRQRQQATPVARSKTLEWQAPTSHQTQNTHRQDNTTIQSYQRSPDTSTRNAHAAAGEHRVLHPTATKAEDKSTGVPLANGHHMRSNHSLRNAHGAPSFDSTKLQGRQDTSAQGDGLRQHRLPQDQGSRISQSCSPQDIFDHDRHHPLKSAHSAAPVTVDPSRVFNPYHQEYQRRKALADAEEAQRGSPNVSPVNDGVVEEQQELAVEEVRPTSENNKSTAAAISGPTNVKTADLAANIEADARTTTDATSSSDKEQMEAEMKLMLEKMREYKAKDPSLFLQIWEQVKKGAPQMASKSQTPSQGAFGGQEASQVAPRPPSVTNGSFTVVSTDNSQLPSPSPTLVQPPVTSKRPDLGSPDLGKFPALRRRPGAGRRSAGKKSGLLTDSHIRPSQSDHVGPSGKTAQGHEPQVQSSGTAPAHGDESCLHVGHQNGNSDLLDKTVQDPIPFVSRTGDGASSNTLPVWRSPHQGGQEAPAGANSVLEPSVAAHSAIPRASSVRNQPVQLSRKDLQHSPTKTIIAPSSHESRGGIIWPDSKKMALAAAAERALTSTGANAGKTISILEIRALLDSNPSYIELCEHFERMGFVFDRGHFARMLLSAVPDVNSHAPAHAQTAINAQLGNPDQTTSSSRASTNMGTHPSMNSSSQAVQPSTNSKPVNGTYIIHGAPVQANSLVPGLLKRSPGRPRKDGSPAQARKGDPSRQLRDSYGNALGFNHTRQAGRDKLPGSHDDSPALAETDQNRQRPGNDGNLHMNDYQRSTAVPETSNTPTRTQPDTPTVTKPAFHGNGNAVQADRSVGPGNYGAHVQKWDPFLVHTKPPSKPVSKEGRLQHAQAGPQVAASVKRGVASNLNAVVPQSSTLPYLSPSNVQTPSNSALKSKEEMARKRNFNDIVDLTQELSGEEDFSGKSLNKRYKEDVFALSNRGPDDSLLGNIPPNTSLAPVVPADFTSGTGGPFTGGPTEISKFTLTTSEPLSQKQALYMKIIKPLDKKDALRRSEYNAKTIARDVLIAAGRHPNMRPLNSHLDSLRKNFYAVEYTSDLSSFDWDLVDPKPVGETGVGSDVLMHDADDEDDGVALFEDNPQFQQIRGSVMSRSDLGLEVIGNNTLARTIKKGHRFKRRSPPRYSNFGYSTRPIATGNGDNTNTVAGRAQFVALSGQGSGETREAGNGSGSTGRVEVTTVPVGQVTSNARLQSAAQILQAGTPGRRARGRLPKSSSSTPSDAVQHNMAGPVKTGTDDENGTKRRGRPPGTNGGTPQRSSGLPGGHATVPTRAKSTADTTPGSSRLRNASTPLEGQPFAVVIDSTSPNGQSGFAAGKPTDSQRKRRKESQEAIRRTKGRPNAASKAEPTYKVYDCRWKDCKAELHNLETLRKHVRKVHRAKAAFGGIPCLWTGCGRVNFVQDRKTGRHTRVHHHLDFGTEDSWDEHMDKKHLGAFAWDLGDGPSAGPSDGPDTDLSDYLSDRQGRRMTPQASLSGPQDALILPAKKQPLRAYNKTHGNKSELEKAQAIFKAIDHRRESVGSGIERGGCTLLTPARRAALRENELVVRVLEEDP